MRTRIGIPFKLHASVPHDPWTQYGPTIGQGWGGQGCLCHKHSLVVLCYCTHCGMAQYLLSSALQPIASCSAAGPRGVVRSSASHRRGVRAHWPPGPPGALGVSFGNVPPSSSPINLRWLYSRLSGNTISYPGKRCCVKASSHRLVPPVPAYVGPPPSPGG